MYNVWLKLVLYYEHYSYSAHMHCHAVDGFYRVPYSEFLEGQSAPSIPVQPISYGDAEHFLSQLDDYDAPDDWVGGLNITYKIAQSQTNTK